MNVRIWANTVSTAPGKSGGHVDARALKDPQAHWGRLIELGVNMIQTDTAAPLIAFLKSDRVRAGERSIMTRPRVPVRGANAAARAARIRSRVVTRSSAAAARPRRPRSRRARRR